MRLFCNNVTIYFLKISRIYYQLNCKPDVINLSFQIEKNEDKGNEKNNFFLVKPMDNSNNKYVNKSMDNLFRYSNVPNILMKNNLDDEHNLIDFGALSKCQ